MKIQIDAEMITTWSYSANFYEVEKTKFLTREDAIKQILFEKDEFWTNFILLAGNDEEVLSMMNLSSALEEKYPRRDPFFGKKHIQLIKNTHLTISSDSLESHGIRTAVETYLTPLPRLSYNDKKGIELLVSTSSEDMTFEEIAEVLRKFPEFPEAFEEAKRLRQEIIDNTEKKLIQEKEDRERTFYQQWKFLEKKRQEGEFEKFLKEEEVSK
jgi:hypothetical protein